MSATDVSLLIVDDDRLIVDLLCENLADDYDPIGAASRAEVPSAITQLGGQPRFALIDLGLPPHKDGPQEGFAVLRDLMAIAPDCAVVVVSGQDKERHGQIARTLGAMEYISKPCDPSELRAALARSRTALDANTSVDGLIGNSPAMIRLRKQIGQFAPAAYPVLIEGESGTGKELVARALHRSSVQSGPFVAINCAALPAQLIESALFGTKRGAYTGASADARGFFAEAAGGTILLDEIGDLPTELQPKLLRILESGEYHRVGDPKPCATTARVIAATNQHLGVAMRAGQFRYDLYHRLAVLAITTPPLRELGADRTKMLELFRAQATKRDGSEAFSLSAKALQLWARYSFPGNVRELRNIVARLQVMHPGAEIDSSTLAAEMLADADPADEEAVVRLRAAPTASLDQLLDIDAATYVRTARRECFSDEDAARRLKISLKRLRAIAGPSGQR